MVQKIKYIHMFYFEISLRSAASCLRLEPRFAMLRVLVCNLNQIRQLSVKPSGNNRISSNSLRYKAT